MPSLCEIFTDWCFEDGIESVAARGSKGKTSPAVAPARESVITKIHELSPKEDTQRSLKAQALNLALQLSQTRVLMVTQRSVPVPKVVLIMLVFWLIALFISFGLFAPSNYTVVVSLFISAAAISGAVFLVVEMYFPYSGLIQVSSEPLRTALAQLGQ